MVYWGEKRSEDFLEKNGFSVVKRALARRKRYLKSAIKKVGFPLVMKVSSQEIVHKNKFKGVIKNINNYTRALEAYSLLKKIPGFKGVILQKEIGGKEIILGIKRTPEFGHVIVFGFGGSEVEEERDVSFRSVPFSLKEAKKMISSTKIGKKLNKREKDLVLESIMDLQEISINYSKISELDINPLIINYEGCSVVDAKIFWD
jgi:hypothetical protein